MKYQHQCLLDNACPFAIKHLEFAKYRLKCTHDTWVDQAMHEKAPAGWKGDDIREKQVLNALFPIMSRDRRATQAVFDLIKNQPGY